MVKTKKRRQQSQQRSKEDKQVLKERLEQELQTLERRVIEEAPASGYTPPLDQRVAFRALPLSERTLRGLEQPQQQQSNNNSSKDDKTGFTTMTDIQNACIPHALAGRDILGAARTGSGKTLAFLVPALELLYRHQYTPADGCGATVLSPTRELAVQIFNVLQSIGRYHTFSVGLLIGGKKDFYEEQQRVATTNILIATPGRLLEHLEKTPYFDMAQLKILILDEADRLLDMGFRDSLVRILDYIPNERQTLLFSATQTRDVKDLATLSLRKPEYLGVHDKEKTSTPESLQQSYVVVPTEHKLDAIFSFIKSHLKSKSIIFMASCAQVRHAWELFCSLRPGIVVMALHGKLVQTKRTQIYFDFLQRPHAILFATDIAARGLDFPDVDWVVQADAPEDRHMYIHRAGRTARYRAGGKALLFLTPAEEEKGFIPILQGGTSAANKVPIKKLSINPSKTVVVTQRAAALVASNVNLHRLAKKAFQSYVRSIHLMPHKEIFDVNDLPLDELSRSLGLASTPNVRFLKQAAQDRSEARKAKNTNKKLMKLKQQIKAEKLAKKLERMGQSAVASSSLKSQQKGTGKGSDDDDSDDDDEVLVAKSSGARTEEDSVEEEEDLPDPRLHEVTNRRNKPKKIRVDASTGGLNKHVVFNEDGQVEDAKGRLFKTDESVDHQLRRSQDELAQATDAYMQKVRERLKNASAQDNLSAKERLRQLRKKRKLQEKGVRDDNVEESDTGGVVLGSPSEGDSEDSGEDSESDDDSEASSDDSGASDDDEKDASDLDIKAQEEMALSLIRGSTSG